MRQGAAIDVAFRDESEMLLRWLSAKLKNRDDAQDVLQSAYARAIAFRDANEIENAKALIFRVAARLAIDVMRRRGRFAANHRIAGAGDDNEALAVMPSDAPDSEQTFIARARRAVRSAILVAGAMSITPV